jgi:hypothetical protein
MENKNVAKKAKAFTIRLSDAEETALKRIAERDFPGLPATTTMMIRFAINDTAKRTSNDDIKDIKTSLVRLESFMQGATLGKGSRSAEPKMSYLEKKEQLEEQKRERGLAICEALGGRAEGYICVYKKYEITAGGFTFESTVSDRLDTINEKAIEQQYFPSKEEYLKLKAEEDAADAAR